MTFSLDELIPEKPLEHVNLSTVVDAFEVKELIRLAFTSLHQEKLSVMSALVQS